MVELCYDHRNITISDRIQWSRSMYSALGAYSTLCSIAAGGMCKKHINWQLENNLPIGEFAFSAQAISGFLLPFSRSLHTLSLVSKQFSFQNEGFPRGCGKLCNHVVLLLSELCCVAQRYSLNGKGQVEKAQIRKTRCILVRHKQ